MVHLIDEIISYLNYILYAENHKFQISKELTTSTLFTTIQILCNELIMFINREITPNFKK